MNITQNLDSHLFNKATERLEDLDKEKPGVRSSSAKRSATSLISVPLGTVKKAARLGCHIIKFIATPLTFIPTPSSEGRFKDMTAYAKKEAKAVLYSIASLAVSSLEILEAAFSPLVLTVTPNIEQKMAFKLAQLNQSIEEKISEKKQEEQIEEFPELPTYKQQRDKFGKDHKTWNGIPILGHVIRFGVGGLNYILDEYPKEVFERMVARDNKKQ